jgi:hydrogenase nickel incorporation protein HypB
MCGVCGCGQPEEAGHGHEHHHAHDHHAHDHHHHHHDHAAGDHHPGDVERRRIQVETDLFAHNDALARANRRRLDAAGTLAVNLMSSPGSGKTTLLCRTLDALQSSLPLAVIEGDQQTSFDADRIRATGVPAHQVNTGRVCHLDAQMISESFRVQALPQGGVLFIENVGNLVCPAGFDLGEHEKVVVVSVTEGEDKPLKYPDMFAKADLVLVNKTDLLPHLRFDVERLVDYVHRIRPDADVLRISATTGAGFDAWLDWLTSARSRFDATNHTVAEAP